MSDNTTLINSHGMFETGELPAVAVEQANSAISDDEAYAMRRKERLRCHVMTACSKPVE